MIIMKKGGELSVIKLSHRGSICINPIKYRVEKFDTSMSDWILLDIEIPNFRILTRVHNF